MCLWAARLISMEDTEKLEAISDDILKIVISLTTLCGM